MQYFIIVSPRARARVCVAHIYLGVFTLFLSLHLSAPLPPHGSENQTQAIRLGVKGPSGIFIIYLSVYLDFLR